MTNLKALRVRNGLSQEALGAELGVGRSTIAMLETGKNKPSYDLLIALAKALNCTVDELTDERPIEGG